MKRPDQYGSMEIAQMMLNRGVTPSMPSKEVRKQERLTRQKVVFCAATILLTWAIAWSVHTTLLHYACVVGC